MNVQGWLDAYKKAWEERDPAAAAALFTEDAVWEMPPSRLKVGQARALSTMSIAAPRAAPSSAYARRSRPTIIRTTSAGTALPFSRWFDSLM